MNIIQNGPIFYFDQIAPDEQWAPITERVVPDIRPYYYISTYGRMITTSKGVPREKSISLDNNGYCKTLVYPIHAVHSEGKCIKIHRVVMLTFAYYPGCEDMEVNHKDGNKANNWIGNLEWCTRLENMHHAINTGLITHIFRSGEDAIQSTTTNVQAEEIGRLLQERELTRKEIAERLGVTENIVANISSGACWRNIYEKYDLGHKTKKRAESVFTYEELHRLCEFFQENAHDSKYDKTKNRNQMTRPSLIKDGFFLLYGRYPVRYIDRDILICESIGQLLRRKSYLGISKDYVW